MTRRRKFMFILIPAGILLIALGLVFLWNRWPEKPINAELSFDKLELFKSKRLLIAWAGEKKVREYKVALGKQPIGHKEYEGDMRTPEGLYTINAKNPNSDYHKNLGVSYPNDKDREHARQIGKSPGGDIKIHGLRNGSGSIGKLHRMSDWTHGCIAVTDEEIDELFAHTPIGTPILIHP